MLINSSFVRVWWYGRADGLFDKKINRGVNMFMWCSCVDKGLLICPSGINKLGLVSLDTVRGILNISAWNKKDWNWIFTHYFSSIYTMHWESAHIRLLYQSSQIVLMNENKPKLSSFQMAYLERLLCLNSDVNLKVKYDSGIFIETILRVWTEDAFILLDPQHTWGQLHL